MKNLTALEISNNIKNKKLSALEVTQFFLNESSKDTCNVFINNSFESAILKAKEIDRNIENGFDFSKQTLLGVPFISKDVFCTKDVITTCGSKILENFKPTYESTATKRILDHGAILIGKSNQDEFCMGSSSETSAFGPVINPLINKEKPNSKTSPGGSSGGSAVAVLNDYCQFSLGTDTGGSIKEPASFCGIYGFRPTYGSISRYGMISYAGSLDQCGFFSKKLEDIAILYDIVSGKDGRDMGLNQGNFDSIYPKFKSLDPKDLRVGIPCNKVFEMVSEEMKRVWKEKEERFKDLGAKIIYFDIPNIEYAIECYAIITMSECFSNLSRYDGIKFGKNEDIKNLDQMYKKNRSSFGYEAKKRIVLGGECLSSEMYNKSYLKATKIRRIISDAFLNNLKNCDVILMPTVADVPFAINEKKNQLEMWLVDLLTLPSNLAGLGGLSIPAGKCGKTNLPLGLQIIAAPFNDLKIIQAASILNL